MIRSGSPTSSHRNSSKTMTAVKHPGRRLGTSTGEIFMRALISALAVAGLVAIALPGYADDVKTNPKPLNAPGRAIDEGGAVTTNPKPLNSPGRAADDTVKTDPAKAAKTPGRAADDTTTTKPAKKSKKKKTQTPAN
jgi:hypothetical protein